MKRGGRGKGGRKGGRKGEREGRRERGRKEGRERGKNKRWDVNWKDKAGWREARVFLRGTKEEDRNGSTCEEHGEEEEGLASPGIREGSN